MNQIDILQGYRLQGRACDMGSPGAAREAKNRAARFGAPVRCAQPGQSRHNRDAPIVGHGSGQPFTFARLPDDAESVAQPLDERA